MSGPLTGWRVLLRIAWRDVLRNKGRSALILVMIALPVLGVTIASTIAATQEVVPSESVERELGTADAAMEVMWRGDRPEGWQDPQYVVAELERLVGGDVTTTLEAYGQVRVSTDKGSLTTNVTEADLGHPLLEGTFRLVAGRLPEREGEAVVNAELASRGPGYGETLEVRGGSVMDIVGVVEDGWSKEPAQAWAMPGQLLTSATMTQSDLDNRARVYVDAEAEALSKAQRELEKHNVYMLTRVDQQHSDSYGGSGFQGADLAVFVLIVVMALIEVVLLAGPSFAVAARRMQRGLALVAATGGSPGQVRRAVLAHAVVLGLIGALAGSALGVAVAWAVLPIAQRYSSNWHGPFDVYPLHLVGIALFGFVSAVLAAMVPAWIASRQDVVRVLAGRRGDRPPMKGSPLIGLAVIGIGVLLTALGLGAGVYGEIWIGFGAVFTVLGSLFLIPLLVRLVATLEKGPLPVRYAVRDALRHRARTVPAVGAVMATVAGVVALSIANSSDEGERERTYDPTLTMGHGVVRDFSVETPLDERKEAWAATTELVKTEFPSAVSVDGLLTQRADTWTDIAFFYEGKDVVPPEGGLVFGSDHLVAGSVPDIDLGLDAAQRKRADEALARGGVVVFAAPGSADSSRVTAELEQWGASDKPTEARFELPAYVAKPDGDTDLASIFSPEAARAVGLEVGPVGISIPAQVSPALEKDLVEAIAEVNPEASVYVERGYERPQEYVLIMLVLMVVGAFLMVAGTLTATVLALNDARPDLATLASVGASPRTRRAVAAAFALVIGGIGAALGALVGLVPGIAASWTLTADVWGAGAADTFTLDIPWLLMLAIVVGLPLLTALVVGLCARSRLPLVARID